LVSKADWAHGVESVWRMGIDAGRTEGAMIVIGTLLALAFLAVVFAVTFKLIGAAARWAFR
jgi:hypothetical protein